MKIRDFLLSNLAAKIFSLVFAAVLWAAVVGEKQGQIQLITPLELANIPDKSVVVSDIPTGITVQVQGPRTLLQTLPGRGIRKVLDLKGMGVGWTTFRILPESIPMPRGIEVIRVTPSTVDIKLESLIEVRLPVSADVVGEPAKGYTIAGSTVEPSKVLLKGGEGELRGLSGVKTRQVSVSQANADVEAKIGLALDGLHLVEVNPASVLVRVKIAPVVGEKVVAGIPVRATPSRMRTWLEPAKVQVVLEGTAVLLEGIKEGDVQVKVSLQGLDPGRHKVAPSVTAPQGVKVVKVEPALLDVKVESPWDQEQRR